MYVITEIENLLKYEIKTICYHKAFCQLVLHDNETLNKRFFEEKNRIEKDYGVVIEPLFWCDNYSIFIRYHH